MSSPYANEVFLHRLLGKALAAGASDVHLKVGKPPGARVRGELVYFRGEKIADEDTIAAARLLFGRGADQRVDGAHDLVFAYEASGLGRFRVSAYRQRGSLSLVLRSLPASIPTFAELGVPAAAAALAEKERGLVIVSGGSGEGKSATVAAMIGHLNQSYARHVITIEDPIELIHEDARGSISQREVGEDVATIAEGLVTSLRHDPDVLVAAALPDAAAFEAALTAAELGHLVIAIVPAPDVIRALGRLHALGRALPDLAPRLAAGLEGVIAQRLVPKRDGSGVALACELLVATAAVREALRGAASADAAAPALRELMEKGATPYGMATFDGALDQLARQGATATTARSPSS